MNGLGSHKDRHARIGEGEIGLEALVRVIRHPVLKNIPFILETPNDDAGWTREITLLREAFEKVNLQTNAPRKCSFILQKDAAGEFLLDFAEVLGQ